jgi:hypothetical protein
MEPTIIVYVGCMSILGLFATNIICKKSSNSGKKEHIEKKRFKHYRSH